MMSRPSRRRGVWNADVAELVDALDLGSSAARRGGSSPLIRTTALFYPKTNIADAL